MPAPSASEDLSSDVCDDSLEESQLELDASELELHASELEVSESSMDGKRRYKVATRLPRNGGKSTHRQSHLDADA